MPSSLCFLLSHVDFGGLGHHQFVNVNGTNNLFYEFYSKQYPKGQDSVKVGSNVGFEGVGHFESVW